MPFTKTFLIQALRQLDREHGADILTVINVRPDDPFDFASLGPCCNCGLPGISYGQARDCRYPTDGREGLHAHVYSDRHAFHLDAVVGHNDGSGTPTHLVAMNLNRQVIILEMPGGDAAKIRTLTGPYLFGANEDKTPVLLRLEDLNRDGAQDLVVSIKNEEIVYVNRDAQFQLMTGEERQKLNLGK